MMEAQRHHYQNNYSLAEQAILNAIHLCPKDAEGWITFSTLLYEMGRVQENIGILRQALQMFPENGEILSRIGDCLLTQGAFTEAETIYKSMLQRMPSPNCYLNLSEVYLRQGDLKKCIKTLNDGLKIDPVNSNILYNLAHVHLILGKVSKAREYALNARLAGANPQKIEGILYLLQKLSKEEIRQYGSEKISDKRGYVSLHHVPEHHGYAIVIEGRGVGPGFGAQNAKLIPSVNAIITNLGNTAGIPEEAINAIYQGNVAIKNNDLHTAEEAFRKAFHVFPSFKAAWHNLIVALLRQNLSMLAVEECRVGEEYFGTDPEAILLIGHALHESGNEELAQKYYLEAAMHLERLDYYGAINYFDHSQNKH